MVSFFIFSWYFPCFLNPCGDMFKGARMKQVKKDIMGYKEFTNISKPTKKQHIPTRDQILPHDDENEFPQEETLVGMEYDIEPEMGNEFNKDWNDEEDMDKDDRI